MQMRKCEAELEADAIKAGELAKREPVGVEQGGGSGSGVELKGKMDTS